MALRLLLVIAFAILPVTPAAAADPAPLSSAALARAITTAGGTATPSSAPPQGFSSLRLSLPSGGTTVTGWVVWSSSIVVDSLVVFAEGLGPSPDLQGETAHVAAAATAPLLGDPSALGATDPDGGVVLSLDHRNPNLFEPDVESVDLAAATALLKKALAAALPAVGVPKLVRTIAAGISAGGATTGLMIENHPGLVQSWIDTEGAVDAVAVKVQADQDVATGTDDNTTALLVQQALDQALGGTATPAQCDPRPAQLSPVCHPALLKGLTQATVVHAKGDELVPVTVAGEMRDLLVAQGVPTWYGEIDPAPGSPATSMYWHVPQPVTDAMNGVVNFDVHGHVTAPGLTTTLLTASL
jgi:hypothetical protein